MVTDNTPGSLFAVSDFKIISQGMKGMMESSPKSEMTLLNRDGWIIRVKGEMAFAIYNEEFLMANGTKIKAKTQKVMEKVKGQWKIATTSSIGDFNNAVVPTPNPEEEAIKKVIIDEMDAYLTSNLEAWANAQTQTPYHSTLHKFAKAYSAVGWDKKYEDAKKTFGTPNDIAYKKSYVKVNRTDWNIQIRDNVAWARWKDMWDMTNGSQLAMYNLKILEKQNNQWRISHVGTYPAPEETFNQTNEEEAIKKLIIDEGKAFGQGNIDAFMNTQADAPYLLWTVTSGGEPGDVLTYRGYKALKEFAMSLPWFKNFKPENAQSATVPTNTAIRDNWSFQFRGNVAIVNFDEHWDTEKQKVKATVIKILEKINGNWKITNTSALADFKDATPPIRSKY